MQENENKNNEEIKDFLEEVIEEGNIREEKDCIPEDEEIIKLQSQSTKNYEMYLRSLAEFENYKKRVAREKEEYIKYSNLPLINKILGVMDDLDRAIEVAKNTQNLGSLSKGVEMTAKNLKDIMNEEGVEHIECVGKPFDPQYHQPLSTEESENYPENTVIQELQPGYIMKGRLIRPSLVKVSK